WASCKDVPVAVPDENMLACAQSRVLNALYNAEVAAKAVAEPSRSFQQLMVLRGTDVPRLAREIDIARSVLADLVNGGMLAPVGKKLVDALTHKLMIAVEVFDRALQCALAS